MAAQPEQLGVERTFELETLAQHDVNAAPDARENETQYIIGQSRRWQKMAGIQLRQYSPLLDESPDAYSLEIAAGIERLAHTQATRDYLVDSQTTISPDQWQFLTEFFNVPFSSSANHVIAAAGKRHAFVKALELITVFHVTIAAYLEHAGCSERTPQATDALGFAALHALRARYKARAD